MLNLIIAVRFKDEMSCIVAVKGPTSRFAQIFPYKILITSNKKKTKLISHFHVIRIQCNAENYFGHF